MNKTYKIVFGLLLLLVISLTWLETSEADPINWNASYTDTDNIALGAKIFFESWKEASADSIQKLNIPPYEYLNNDPAQGTYFFLNDYVSFDDDELEDLLQWVSKGNTVFISASGFGENLSDTLKVSTQYYISDEIGFTSRPQVNFYNPELHLEKNLEFDQDLSAVSFGEIDTLQQTILGYSVFNENKEKRANFIRLPFGKGEIYLHTLPQLFSNYFLLKDKNYVYAEKALAYIPKQQVLWDGYYKSGKSFYSSPLYILLNNRPLKWAYYFVLIASILFILFEGKRKQRKIPVVEPLQNKSYEFTETISNLYIEQKRFYELGQKKIALFLEFIRTHYRLDTQQFNIDFYRNLSAKSGHDLETTQALFQKIESFQEQRKNNKNDFFELSQNINTFKTKDGKSGK